MTDYLSFLAPPDAVSDWRMVVLYEAAAGTGLLEVIAGAALTPAVLAERLGLDQQAVRVVIEALAAWEVVDVEETGGWYRVQLGPRPASRLRYATTPGRSAPGAPTSMIACEGPGPTRTVACLPTWASGSRPWRPGPGSARPRWSMPAGNGSRRPVGCSSWVAATGSTAWSSSVAGSR